MIDTTIERPSPEVFAYLSDFEKNPTWQDGMRRCEWITGPPLRAGSRYRQEADFLGREITSTFEVSEYEPGMRVTAHTIEGTFPIRFTRWVEAIDDSTTRVRAIVEGESSGFFRLFGPLLAPLVRRSIRRDYARLKKLLEGE